MGKNSDIVSEILSHFPHRADANLRLIEPDAVMDWSASRAPYAGVYSGLGEIRRLVEAHVEAWEEWRTEVIEAIEPDAETVVIVSHIRARGRGSGIIVDAHGASIWKLRDGLVTRGTLYQDKAEALEALEGEKQAG